MTLGSMPHGPSILTRRQLLLLLAATARLEAADEDFWNTKPLSEWNAGDIYRVMNHSPWANPVQWWCPLPSLRSPDERPHSQLGPKGVVTWESAQPIRDALKTPLPRVFANFYVVGVDGVPSGSHSAGYLRRFAALRSNGKPKWSVGASVARELIRNSAVYAFGFPKGAAPIGPDTGDVVFEMELGQWMVQTKFKPKDMLYHGELAL
jgi:hypothetical protein